jgi:hypothetical protein
MMRVVIRIVLAAMASLLLATEGWTQPLALSYPSPTYNNVNIFGNATIGGALGISGAATFSGGMAGTLTGHATLDLPLTGGNVSGDSTFSGSGTGLTVTNNTTIGGTLGVTGAATFSTINGTVYPVGADPTGVTDSTAALQAALTAGAGKAVVFPPGTYKVNATALLYSPGTTISGYGATLVAGSGYAGVGTYPTGEAGGEVLLNVGYAASSLAPYNVTIEGLTINCVASEASVNGIGARMAQGVRVKDVQLWNCGTGTRFMATDDTRVESSLSDGSINAAFDHFDGPTNAKIIGNTIRHPGAYASLFNAGSPNATTQIADNFEFIGNTVTFSSPNSSAQTALLYGPLGSALHPLGAHTYRIVGNDFDLGGLSIAAAVLQGAPGNYVISGNTFRNGTGTASAVYVRPEVEGSSSTVPSGITVEGNTVYNWTTTSALFVISAGSYQRISGNVATGSTYAYLVNLAGSTSAVAEGNVGAAGTSGRILTAGATTPLAIDPDADNGKFVVTGGFQFGTAASAGVLSTYSPDVAWTPVLSFGGASTGITYSTQSGYYTQIGKLVYYNAQIVLTNVGSATGNALISGLPGTPVGGGFGAVVRYYANMPSVVSAPFAQQSSGSLILYQAGSSNVANLTNTNFEASTTLNISGWYMTP